MSRFLFKNVAVLSQNFKPRSLPITDENGLILSRKVIKSWQYCEKLMASDNTDTTKERKI